MDAKMSFTPTITGRRQAQEARSVATLGPER